MVRKMISPVWKALVTAIPELVRPAWLMAKPHSASVYLRVLGFSGPDCGAAAARRQDLIIESSCALVQIKVLPLCCLQSVTNARPHIARS